MYVKYIYKNTHLLVKSQFNKSLDFSHVWKKTFRFWQSMNIVDLLLDKWWTSERRLLYFYFFTFFFCCDEETSNYTPPKVQAFVKTSLIDKKGFLWWFIKLWRQPALQTKYVNGMGYTYFCKECDSFYIVKRFLILNTFEAW